MPSVRALTEEQIDELARLYDDGRGPTMHDLAMQFHVSPSTVSKYLTERGVSLRWGGKRTTPEQDRIEEIRRLYWVEYKTTHEIADIIGISQRTVHSRMRKYDVPTRRACWRPPHMRPRKGESREAVRRRQIVWGE